MEVIVSRGCGLDVHQATVVACLLTSESGRLPRKQVKTFSAMTEGLIELRDWLKKAGCTAVAMEATGVYWKPVHNLLEVLRSARRSCQKSRHAGSQTDVLMPRDRHTSCATDVRPACVAAGLRRCVPCTLPGKMVNAIRRTRPRDQLWRAATSNSSVARKASALRRLMLDALKRGQATPEDD